MRNKFILFTLLTFIYVNLFAFGDENSKPISNDFGPDVKATKNFLRYSSSVNALNVKLMPAFFWSSLGVEVEYPMSDLFTIGVNVVGKVGRTDGKKVVFKIRPENHQESAYRLEVAAKYYISQSAPIGFYGQLNFSYGNLLYYDGTNRPYTMHSKWKNFDSDIRKPTDIQPPKDYSLGIGGGYQLIVIPKKFIANIMVGTQLYLDRTSGMYPSFYVSPSLGYVF